MGSKPCVLHPDSNHTTEQCKKLRDLKTSQPNYNPSGTGKGKGKNKGKGKARTKGNRNDKPQWKTGPNKGTNPKGKGRGRGRGTGADVTCSHCHKAGHEARDCFTRKREMNQTTTNFIPPHTDQDNVELPIELRNYVTFVKRQRDDNDYHTSWQDDETPPSTPSSEDETMPTVRENMTNEQEESSSNPEPGKNNGKNESEGSSSDLILGPVNPSTWQSLHRHQNDEYEQLDWGRGKIKSNYSPPRTQPYRSGLCQYCDKPMGS